MSVHYRYDAPSHRLFTRCEGEVKLDEVIDHFRELTGLTRLHPHSDVVLDLTFQTNLPDVEPIDSAVAVLEQIRELVPLGRCAMVAANAQANEIAQRFQALGWPLFSGTRIFPSAADATAWLDDD